MLDKTAQEIADVIMAGGSIVILTGAKGDGYYDCNDLSFMEIHEPTYYRFVISERNYNASSPTDYPTYSASGGAG